MPKSIKTSFYISLVTLLAGFLLFPMAVAQGPSGAQNGTVKVLTYNVNEGSDYTEVLSAQTFDQFLKAVQITLDTVIASNPPLRMQAVAHQIGITQPDLVGLQEVTTWRVGPGPNPTDLKYDMLQELLDALQAQGLNYKPVVVVNEFQLQGPLPDGINWVSASNSDVLLARADKGDLQLSNVKSGHFNVLLTIPTLIGSLTVERGWGSVDVALHGQSFRFIVTHIENAIPGVPETIGLQMEQAYELSVGPANTDLPVIIAGDFNADAHSAADGTIATYNEMLNLGFGDAWATLHPETPGLTWQLVDSSPIDTAWQRIDFIFYRGHLNPRTASIAGNAPQDKVDGLWPSDHAGVRALLQLGQE